MLSVNATSRSESHGLSITPLLHKDKAYRAIAILNQIPPHITKEIGFRDPAHFQSFWDELARRRPDIADLIIANIDAQETSAKHPAEIAEAVESQKRD